MPSTRKGHRHSPQLLQKEDAPLTRPDQQRDWPGRFERPRDKREKGRERRPVAVTSDNQRHPERHLAAKKSRKTPLHCESLASASPVHSLRRRDACVALCG